MTQSAVSASSAARDLRVVVGRLRRRLREFHPDDLTPSQVSVLSRLGKQGPLSASELAAAERVRPQSVAATLLVLDGHGLIDRCPDPNDRRKQLLSLSETGRNMFESARRTGEEWLANALDARYAPEELNRAGNVPGGGQSGEETVDALVEEHLSPDARLDREPLPGRRISESRSRAQSSREISLIHINKQFELSTSVVGVEEVGIG